MNIVLSSAEVVEFASPWPVVIFFGAFVVLILAMMLMAGPSVKRDLEHDKFMRRFKAYHPNAEIVEIFHCSVVIRRGENDFVRISENEQSEFVEESFRPFAEKALS